MLASSSHHEVRTALLDPTKPQFAAGLHPQAHTRIRLQIIRQHLRNAMPVSQKGLHYVSTSFAGFSGLMRRNCLNVLRGKQAAQDLSQSQGLFGVLQMACCRRMRRRSVHAVMGD